MSLKFAIEILLIMLLNLLHEDNAREIFFQQNAL